MNKYLTRIGNNSFLIKVLDCKCRGVLFQHNQVAKMGNSTILIFEADKMKTKFNWVLVLNVTTPNPTSYLLPPFQWFCGLEEGKPFFKRDL